ncbi:MAG: class I SAM-dependent methyltransferase [Bacteroidota bacterium]|nr:class I SAM-dependent methyltransferase [Bacteroidota bacterium]
MDKAIIEKYADMLQGNDKGFFGRVWQTSDEVYLDRLKAIGFENFNHVLDAGFGFGQWMLPLSKLNKKVSGIEFAQNRFETVKKMFDELKLSDIDLRNGSIEKTTFDDNSFDAIFCYSVILCTDVNKTLTEMHRVLKKGGKFYLNSNGLGWYIYNMLEDHNPASDFSPRQMAIETIENTINYLATGKTEPGKLTCTSKAYLISRAEAAGFKLLEVNGEGKINLFPDKVQPKSFFKDTYYDREGVFELLLEKL